MGYTSSQAKNFIKEIAPLIQAEAKKRGYAICSTVIAQAIIESGITSTLAIKYHNYFGMKCGSKWKGKSVNLRTKEEYTVGTLTTIRDNFRVYDSMAEGVSGYYDFIAAKRYANLKTADSYTEYAELLKKDGYATSSTYVNTLVNTVKKYDLTKYDGGNVVSNVVTTKSNEEIAKEVLAGKWGNGAERKSRLTQAGYDYKTVQSIVNKLVRT